MLVPGNAMLVFRPIIRIGSKLSRRAQGGHVKYAGNRPRKSRRIDRRVARRAENYNAVRHRQLDHTVQNGTIGRAAEAHVQDVRAAINGRLDAQRHIQQVVVSFPP